MELDQTTPSKGRILECVAKEYGLSADAIRNGKCRNKTFAEARQVYCFLCYKHTSFTFLEIGAYINRTHPTVSYSVDKMAFLYDHDKAFAARIDKLTDLLENE